MNNCIKQGCRNLELRCKDCGRIVSTAKIDTIIKCKDCFYFKLEKGMGVLKKEVGFCDLIKDYRWADQKACVDFKLKEGDKNGQN